MRVRSLPLALAAGSRGRRSPRPRHLHAEQASHLLAAAPGTRSLGQYVVYDIADLDAWAAERKVRSDLRAREGRLSHAPDMQTPPWRGRRCGCFAWLARSAI